MNEDLRAFVRESNLIEGIDRDPSSDEIDAHQRLLILFNLHPTTLGLFQAVIAPNMPLRSAVGMNVRVGHYIAPDGGPNIERRLQAICNRANTSADPWDVHVRFEKLHPYMDGNGRTGRALWAWMMLSQGKNPFALPFLHRFYYQTLENS